MEIAETSESELLALARDGDEGAFRALFEGHRAGLRRYCYSMLGSVHDAEDAVQNAMLRAWRGLRTFEGRGSVRSWLYAIAANTALDAARHRSQRELPVDFGPAAVAGAPVADAAADPAWLEPCPDQWLAGAPEAEPGARYELRESVEIAFMVMLAHLPPLQRAVLILRDVLGFPAADVAAQLSTSTAAVNSALQRARAGAQARLPGASQQSALRALGGTQVAVIAAQYADALESGDVGALLSLLTKDATWCMPPSPTWFQGHAALAPWLVRDPLSQRWRHAVTRASGQLAVGGYLFSAATGTCEPAVIDVLTLTPAGKISAVTAFVLGEPDDPATVFAAFGLPASSTAAL